MDISAVRIMVLATFETMDVLKEYIERFEGKTDFMNRSNGERLFVQQSIDNDILLQIK